MSKKSPNRRNFDSLPPKHDSEVGERGRGEERDTVKGVGGENKVGNVEGF